MTTYAARRRSEIKGARTFREAVTRVRPSEPTPPPEPQRDPLALRRFSFEEEQS